MSWFSAAWQAVTVARDAADAAAAGLAELDAGHGPLRALRTFAGQTDGALDDAVVEQLAEGLRTAVRVASTVARVAASVAAALDDPAMRARLEAGIDAVIAVGYRAGQVRATLDGWLADDATP